MKDALALKLRTAVSFGRSAHTGGIGERTGGQGAARTGWRGARGVSGRGALGRRAWGADAEAGAALARRVTSRHDAARRRPA
jgi:hypothetical protein